MTWLPITHGTCSGRFSECLKTHAKTWVLRSGKNGLIMRLMKTILPSLRFMLLAHSFFPASTPFEGTNEQMPSNIRPYSAALLVALSDSSATNINFAFQNIKRNQGLVTPRANPIMIAAAQYFSERRKKVMTRRKLDAAVQNGMPMDEYQYMQRNRNCASTFIHDFKKKVGQRRVR